MLALALTLALHGVPDDYDFVRTRGNTSGLVALSVWSVASAVTGAVGLATTSDPRWKGAHLANLAWGVINIGFSVLGLYLDLRPEAKRSSPQDAYADGLGLQRTYAINAALDVGYLAVGALLWSKFGDARVQGFGQASLIQALWLLAFDSTMALFHQLNNQRVTP